MTGEAEGEARRSWPTLLVSFLSLAVAVIALIVSLVFSSRGDDRAEAQLRAERRQHLIAADEALVARDPATAGQKVALALELVPDDAETVWYDGRVALESGQLPRAIERFEAALRLDPGLLQAKASLGRAWSMQRRFDEALAVLGDRPCDDDPESNLEGWVRLFLSRGGVYTQLDRIDDARACYDQARKLDPNNPVALWGLGNVAFARQDCNAAIDFYAKSLQGDPQNSEVLIALATCSYLTDEYEVAEQAARRAIEFHRGPFEDPNHLRLLAATLEAQGRDEAAGEYRERADRATSTLDRFLRGIAANDG